MQKLLGQSTSLAVAEELWEQKNSLLTDDGRFPGWDLPVTILFSNTVEFRTVSEGMNPSELLDGLNLGMEKLVKIIISSGIFRPFKDSKCKTKRGKFVLKFELRLSKPDLVVQNE